MSDLIASARNMTVVAEGQYNTVGFPKGALTPNTITAMMGMVKDQALKIPAEATSALTKLQAVANTSPYYGAAQSLASSLQWQQSTMMSSNANFGKLVNAAAGHVQASIDLKSATTYMKGIDFNNLGSGITKMSDLVDQGLTSKLGDLSAVSSVLGNASGAFDLKDMTNFGSPAGMASKMLNTLGENSSVAKALASQGVDTEQLSDPNFSNMINNSFKSIKDPTKIAAIGERLGIDTTGCTSLLDIASPDRLITPDLKDKLSGGLTDIGSKLSDMGAKFANPSFASTVLGNIEKPDLSMLDSMKSSLPEMIGQFDSDFEDLTGPGTGLNGVPKMSDIFGAVSGGGKITDIANGNINASTIAALQTQLDNANAIMSSAGISSMLTAPTTPSLSDHMTFATNLHKFGAQNLGGVSDMLKSMANSSSAYGQAIQSSLAEGKNKALLSAAGVPPLDFSGAPNPFQGLPAGGDANKSYSSAQQLLGGSGV